MIKIDLNETFNPTSASQDLTKFTFIAPLKDDSEIEIQVLIEKHGDPHLPDVYNLAFGPIDENNEIDDTANLKHKNVNKVFSTVLFYAITFLENAKPEEYSIGVDGSNDTRAYLYHRMFRYNDEELSELIANVGVDWYVKLLRNGTDIERDN